MHVHQGDVSPSSEGGREGRNALMQNRDRDGEGLGTVRRDKGWGARHGERREAARGGKRLN